MRENLTCLKALWYSLQDVSTMNFVLKMLHNFAPYPFLPPVQIHNLQKIIVGQHQFWWTNKTLLNCKKKILHIWNKLCTCNFLLAVIIVARCQEVSKYHCWDIHLLRFMFNNRNPPSIVPNFDFVVLSRNYTIILCKKIKIKKINVFKFWMKQNWVNDHLQWNNDK